MADLQHLPRSERRRRAEELLRRFELVDAADKRAATYSGGMRRRLDLAMTLVGEPRIIFLDEPTTGLDPRSRRTMWQIVRDLVDRGVTIFLTTQYLDEADELADRIAVLDQGRIVASGTPAELKSRVPGGHIKLQFPEEALVIQAETILEGASRDGALALNVVPGDAGVSALRALLTKLDDAAIEVDALSVHTPDLDDVFFALTGRPATDIETSEKES
jgi:ABC-2 type transport system ATP-binding protein